MAYTRTLLATTTPTGGLTRQSLREEMLEPWLAETNSDFFSDTVQNYALNHELRKFCADTGAGPQAQFSETGDGTTRFWALPREIVDLWRVDYDTTKDEIPFLPFQQFALRFGTDWIAGTGTGLPDAYCIMGSHGLGFEPIPANTITWRLYGPIIPDAPADTAALPILDIDAYTVAARAYVWMVRRDLTRKGGATEKPVNFQDALAEAREGTEKAKKRLQKLYGHIRAAGSVPDRSTRVSMVQAYGPQLDWD